MLRGLALCTPTLLLFAEGARLSRRPHQATAHAAAQAQVEEHQVEPVHSRSNPEVQSFPEFNLPSDYQDPLAANGGLEKERAIMSNLDDASYDNYIKTLADPNIGDLRATSRFAKDASIISPVKEYLAQEFRSLGVTTCVQTFQVGWFSKWDVHNVIGVVPGTEPGVVVLGAHYDDLPSRGNAPGAVDNGSGTAAVLASLKALMAVGAKPKKSIYFVAFGGEEDGLHGSARLVKELQSPGSSDSPIPAECLVQGTQADTVGVTMDMIGWRNPSFSQNTVLLETTSWSKAVLNPLAMASQVHNGDNLKLLFSDRPFGSDHMSFLNAGFEASLSIDNDGNTFNFPCYHKSCDTYEYISLELAIEITKMNLGATLRLAGLN